MNLVPSETDRELAGAVRVWAGGLGARIERGEQEGTLPREVVRELGALGVLGMTVPERDGGLGASNVAFALVLEELAAAWPSLAVGVSVNSGIVAGSIARYGSAEQRHTWLPRLMDGNGLGAFALTEPSSGSDAASLKATAVKDGDGWRISGRKQFITSARYAPLFIVLARVGSPEPRRAHAGITAFVVPQGTPGLVIGAAERKMGLRASDTSAIVLEDARVGADALLGEVGKGFGLALVGLDGGRIGIAAQAVGIARAALAHAVAYARGREQFGRSILEFEAIRFAIAQAQTEVDAARLLTYRAARQRDCGQPFTREASMAKLYANMSEYAAERYARDARATTLYEGTSEIQRWIIADTLVNAA